MASVQVLQVLHDYSDAEAAEAVDFQHSYHHKQTSNPAFRWYWVMVGYLGWRCERIIRAGDR